MTESVCLDALEVSLCAVWLVLPSWSGGRLLSCPLTRPVRGLSLELSPFSELREARPLEFVPQAKESSSARLSSPELAPKSRPGLAVRLRPASQAHRGQNNSPRTVTVRRVWRRHSSLAQMCPTEPRIFSRTCSRQGRQRWIISSSFVINRNSVYVHRHRGESHGRRRNRESLSSNRNR